MGRRFTARRKLYLSILFTLLCIAVSKTSFCQANATAAERGGLVRDRVPDPAGLAVANATVTVRNVLSETRKQFKPRRMVRLGRTVRVRR